ncbi:MAG: hypothetical protein KDK23_12180 [Leptospiraceae bacterium]|nr:hypothetical protein [Leptospiraceae bacterium]
MKSRSGRKLFALTAVLVANFVLFQCSESRSPGSPEEVHRDPGKYAGTYVLLPAVNPETIILKPDGTAIRQPEKGKREIGFVRRDSRMLRIYLQDSQRPVGLFLLEDFDPNDWRGVWDNTTRILKRQ